MLRQFLILSFALMLTACQQSGEEVAQSAEQTAVDHNTVDQIAADAVKVKSGSAKTAPKAKKIPHTMTAHGDSRIDEYYWMRDDQRTNPEILDHLRAENEYTNWALSHTKDLQGKIVKELNERISKDDSTVPYKSRGYYYYQRYEGEKEYPIYARKKATLEAAEEILLDGNKMAEGAEYFSIGDFGISQNNQLLAYSTDYLSRRVYTVEFKDLTNGQLLADKLENTSGQVIWANDNKTLFYIRKDPQTLLGYQVYRHALGTSQQDDSLVYEETDATFYTWLGKTKDDSFIYIYHDSTLSKGASVIDANQPNQAPSAFLPLEENHEYSFIKSGDWFYVRTNWQAKNFRVMKVQQKQINDKNNWLEVVAHNPEVFIKDIELLKNHLLINESENGQNRIRSIRLKDNQSSLLTFDDPVYDVGFSDNFDPASEILRISYSSLTTPESIFDYDLVKNQKELRKQDIIPGGFHPANYQSERIFIKARDGQQVPVSLVYRKDKFKKDGTNPLYQYGYGSYGSIVEPSFRANRLSLLDRGFVFAIAHIRGGQTKGRSWYEEGKMFNKKNTFNDFVDVTKALVEQQYAAKDKVFASGGSAGGLLMGAVINQAPELYLGVGAHVPFVDVVTTMSDPSIPLTTNEYDEWGNPENPASYQYMLSYSPYDQVKAQPYPNILVTTGLHDSQVQYFEPAKWVAKLRELKTDNNLLVFQTNMEAGHGGASGRFRRNEEIALEYAFFLNLAGIRE